MALSQSTGTRNAGLNRRTYRTTAKAIAEANGLNEGLNHELDKAAVAPETRLIIPIATGKDADTSTYARAITRYKIRRGDTVESVADNFGVSAKMVRGWNHLKGESLAGRKILYLHLPVTATAEVKTATRRAGSRAVGTHHQLTQTAASKAALVKRHKVKQGETLYSIANSYNTTVTALKHDNQNIASLRPGMILIIRPLR